jgi:lipoprotein-anchoring transpeptidase ErfK/SrfK
MFRNFQLSRREFLRLGSISGASVLLNPFLKSAVLETFPTDSPLGRVTEPFANVRLKPDFNSSVVEKLDEDTIIPIQKEVIGYMPYRNSQLWVETSNGYIWSPILQRVKNLPNIPNINLTNSSIGNGMWVEVTVPWVDVKLDNQIPFGPRIKYLIDNFHVPRLYFSQIVWVDQIKTESNGQVSYHLIEPYGSYGDRFWGPAEAFRPITQEETTPINPEVENKRIDINIPRQTLSCFENDREIYFCRVSTGRLEQETPIGLYFQIFWKLISVHMSAGTAGAGYDLTGVGWPTFFALNGIAIHSTFWHHDFGTPTSAGCVNCLPDDAKFVSRWTSPTVPYDPGMVDIGSTGIPSTIVRVLET